MQRACEVRAVVSTVVVKKQGISSISHGWWDKSRKRHPELVLNKGEMLRSEQLLSIGLHDR